MMRKKSKCSTPEEAWIEIRRILGTNLIKIQHQGDAHVALTGYEPNKIKRGHIIDNAFTDLALSIIVVSKQMRYLGYLATAETIAKVLVDIILFDVTDRDVRRMIQEKHPELNEPGVSQAN